LIKLPEMEVSAMVNKKIPIRTEIENIRDMIGGR
jgi:hypothetical protein